MFQKYIDTFRRTDKNVMRDPFARDLLAKKCPVILVENLKHASIFNFFLDRFQSECYYLCAFLGIGIFNGA